jgi:xanthine dehydrogenase small subunit
MPILIVLGAVLKLRRGDVVRELALEDFYLGYQKKALQPGEFIEAVSVPLPVPGRLAAVYKISKRNDQDISAVCGAYAFNIVDGQIQAARIAYGGMAATPKRATHAEAVLIGKDWSLASINAAMAELSNDYSPLSDMRASADYRLTVAKNLLRRFYLEQTTPLCRITQLDGVAS